MPTLFFAFNVENFKDDVRLNYLFSNILCSVSEDGGGRGRRVCLLCLLFISLFVSLISLVDQIRKQIPPPHPHPTYTAQHSPKQELTTGIIPGQQVLAHTQGVVATYVYNQIGEEFHFRHRITASGIYHANIPYIMSS